MSKIIPWILVAGTLLAILFAPSDQDETDKALERYCEMVELRKASGDVSLGWPDYKRIYDTECKD